MTPDTLNRSTMNDSGDLSVYAPNALNQYTDINGGGIYYDGNFNLMWSGGFSAGYDADKRLTAIGSGENFGQFVYDGLGRCVKRTVDWETILITYDGWKPIVEWDQWNGLKAWNVYGAGPDEILYRHDAYLAVDLRYHLDRMGNVAFILDSDGNGIERYTYDVFGAPTVTDWNGNNPRSYSWYGNRFMFTGRDYFAGLGLYDYRNRFYYPVLGRFLQTDPLGLQTEGAKLTAGQKALFSPGGVAPEAFTTSEMNLYRYCGDDPVDRSDPLGLAPGDSYSTRDAAAIAAMTDIAQISVDKDREFGGELYTKKDGMFSYTAAREGDQHRSPMFHKVPNYEGYYHSHGKESGPKYDDENFSGRPTDSPNKKSDKKLADDTQKPGYLVTPSGDIKRYDPDPNKQRNGPVTVVKKIEIKKKEN